MPCWGASERKKVATWQELTAGGRLPCAGAAGHCMPALSWIQLRLTFWLKVAAACLQPARQLRQMRRSRFARSCASALRTCTSSRGWTWRPRPRLRACRSTAMALPQLSRQDLPLHNSYTCMNASAVQVLFGAVRSAVCLESAAYVDQLQHPCLTTTGKIGCNVFLAGRSPRTASAVLPLSCHGVKTAGCCDHLAAVSSRKHQEVPSRGQAAMILMACLRHRLPARVGLPCTGLCGFAC